MAPTLIPIDRLVEIEVDGIRRWTGHVEIAGSLHREVVILSLNGGLVAVRNRCPHRDQPIANGKLDEADGTIECPSHGWRLPIFGFDLDGCQVVAIDNTFYLDPGAQRG